MLQPNTHRRSHIQSRFLKRNNTNSVRGLELLGKLLEMSVKLSATVGFLILFLFWNDIGYIPVTDTATFAISSAAAVAEAALIVLGSSLIIVMAYFGRYTFDTLYWSICE
jgi:hypothetical protein